MLVFVAQNVPETGHLAPRDFRMPGLHLVRQVTAGFRDDLNAPLHQPALAPVSFECVEGYAFRLGADAFDGVDDIAQARRGGAPSDQNTCNAEASIRLRKTGCRLPRVMMSVLQPRISAARSFTSINWNRPSLPRS